MENENKEEELTYQKRGKEKCSNERGVDVNNSLKLTFENLLQIVILISQDFQVCMVFLLRLYK